MLVFFFQIKQNPFKFNPHQQKKTEQQNAKPKKQNLFEFNSCPQNTNQIKHLEQTKERNNKGETKVLGHEAKRDERRIMGFL